MPPYLIEKIISRRKRCDKKARANYCGISPLAHTSAQTSARNACSFFISVSTYAQAQVERI